jgi:hypothetical protein
LIELYVLVPWGVLIDYFTKSPNHCLKFQQLGIYFSYFVVYSCTSFSSFIVMLLLTAEQWNNYNRSVFFLLLQKIAYWVKHVSLFNDLLISTWLSFLHICTKIFHTTDLKLQILNMVRLSVEILLQPFQASQAMPGVYKFGFWYSRHAMTTVDRIFLIIKWRNTKNRY